jgi:sulfur carrier protein
MPSGGGTRNAAANQGVSMRIILNGEPMQLDDSPTLAELLQRTGHAERRIAVEINRAIVPRSMHAVHRLADGDRVEIVQALGGG